MHSNSTFLTRDKRPQLFLVAIAIFIIGCSTATSAQQERAFEQSGKASYYARKFHGRTTASGERYNEKAMTAAHRTLPFGAKVEVQDLKSGRKILVRINDRGPFVKGRIIDLTRAAFDRIGNLDSGLIKVKIQVLN